MKKKILILGLGLLLIAVMSFVAIAGPNQNTPVNTATNYSAATGCDDCSGEPVLLQLRQQVERELLLGEQGFMRLRQQQRFGN